MISLEGFARIGQVFALRDFRLFQLGRLAQLIGEWIYRVGVGWLTWELTESAAWLGIMGFVDQAPAIIVSPIAGVMADRVKRISLLQIAQTMALLQAAILSALVLLGVATVEIVAVLVFLHGVAAAATQPAAHSIIPSITPGQALSTAIAINALIFNLSRFVGPMLAGPLILQWGSGTAILANVIGSTVFIFMLMQVRVDESEVTGNRPDRGDRRVVKQIVEGLQYTVHHPGMRSLMIIVTAVSVLCFPLISLLPGFVAEVFHRGADALALMIAVMGIGAMAQGTYLAQRGPVRGLTRWIIINLLIAGTAFSAMIAASELWMGLVLMFIIGFGVVANRAGSQTLFHHAVAAEMRGRISSFYGMIFHGGPAVGALIMGIIAEYYGFRAVVAGSGFLLLGFWLWALKNQQTIAHAMEIEPKPKRA